MNVPTTQVRMRTRYATEVQTAQPGDVINVPVPEAESLIEGRFAEPLGGRPERTVPATAPVAEPVEASKPRAPRRHGRR